MFCFAWDFFAAYTFHISLSSRLQRFARGVYGPFYRSYELVLLRVTFFLVPSSLSPHRARAHSSVDETFFLESLGASVVGRSRAR